MKKLNFLLLLVLFYSSTSFALHGTGVTQHFETGSVTFYNNPFSFSHVGDSYIDLSVYYSPGGVDYGGQSVLTVNDLYFSGLYFNRFSWDLSTGLAIESDCIAADDLCSQLTFHLGNIVVSWTGGSDQSYYNEGTRESGELFFKHDVTVDADLAIGSSVGFGYYTSLHVSSVPLPGSVILLASGLVLMTRFIKKKSL